MINKIFHLLVLVIVANTVSTAWAQENKLAGADSVIISAMKDELYRSLDKLSDKEAGKPFFISYTFSHGEVTEASATLGTLRESDQYKTSDWTMRLMMGNYDINDENFRDVYGNQGNRQGSFRREPPIEPDYQSIRNFFWWNTSNIFRSASKNYVSKLAALKDKPLKSEEEKLPDYTQATPVKIIRYDSVKGVKKEQLESLSREVSSVFRNVKEVYASNVSVYFFRSSVYILNTEGSEICIPLDIATVNISASVNSDKGETLKNNISFTSGSISDLPPVDSLKAGALKLANYLVMLKDAQTVNENYTGPVLFYDDGAADVFSGCLFDPQNPLISSRDPLVNSLSKSMIPKNNISNESKLEKRVISKDITVKSYPHLKKYNGIPLLGAFDVDAECIIPPDEITLIDKGILKTLLSDRVPTQKIRQSNGHNRIGLGYGGFTTGKGPGVILVESENKKQLSALKNQIIDIGKEKGLDYVFEVRPVLSCIGQGPLCYYKIDVSTGKEELVRPMVFPSVELKTLNKVAGCGNGAYVQNILFSAGSQMYANGSGFPASFIVPNAVLIDELELNPQFQYPETDMPLFPNAVMDEDDQ